MGGVLARTDLRPWPLQTRIYCGLLLVKPGAQARSIQPGQTFSARAESGPGLRILLAVPGLPLATTGVFTRQPTQPIGPDNGGFSRGSPPRNHGRASERTCRLPNVK
jgi:hypothetical protein